MTLLNHSKNTTTSFLPFDAAAVRLEGTNLVEASAGTGKTYSIAILVLRFLIEKDIPLKEILMVTFTKAAVAELQERVRLFIQQGYKASLGEGISDLLIAALVKQAALKQGLEEVQRRIKEAMLFLDETAVLTIHSFCQQTLTEFAFETGQLFGAETMQDTSTVVLDELNKFWRRHITTLAPELLSILVKHGLDRMKMREVINQHLSGKLYVDYDAAKTYGYCEEDQHELIRELKIIQQKEEALTTALHHYVDTNSVELKRLAATNSFARKLGLSEFEKAEDFVAMIVQKKDTGYVQKLFAEALVQCNDCQQVKDEIQERVHRVQNELHCQAIRAVEEGVQLYKQRNNLLSFDDMIVQLHNALTARPNPSLVTALQQKYQVVFVDEFQDTDRLQYEIFQAAFGNNTVLFLIGDPKQSIYAWRKADIFTYFKAREQVQHRYTMNQNFRSAAPMIAAMNLFFEPEPGFDTFAFGTAEERISYHPVQSPHPNSKGQLCYKGEAVVPLTITHVQVADEVVQSVATQVLQLLMDKGFTLQKSNQQRHITPGDIGILVRSKNEGKKVKSALAVLGVPAVTIDEAKVLQTEEARYLMYLLQAMLNTTSSSINKALLSPFTGLVPQQLLQLNNDVVLARFRMYRDAWQNDGVHAALLHFIHDFKVAQVLLGNNTEGGERLFANLRQLTELLHNVQNNKQFSPAECISWLQRSIEGMETEGDEYEQRIETDEEAVKIVTIHKSKGLEYNIVFAPFLDFKPQHHQEILSFRNPETGHYQSLEKNRMSEAQLQWVEEQNEQENRRLVYVAITRAVYKCYVAHNARKGSSTLTRFLQALPHTHPLINYAALEEIDTSLRYKSARQPAITTKEREVSFRLMQNNWMKMSYTFLAKKGEINPRPKSRQHNNAYDQFVYQQLPRGNKTGNLLHYLFEHIHFGNAQQWPFAIAEALKHFLPTAKPDFTPMLMQLLQQVMWVQLSVGEHQFSLQQVTPDRCLHELEFDFPVPEFNPALLNDMQMVGLPVYVSWSKPMQGVVNGKMDLFFEHGGRYYILDWKSNYLGDTVADYAAERLHSAMSDNNYHLQYLLYTLAADKYLRSRLPGYTYESHFGGVIYVFVRGVRQSSTAGLFTMRPTQEQLDLMQSVLEG